MDSTRLPPPPVSLPIISEEVKQSNFGPSLPTSHDVNTAGTPSTRQGEDDAAHVDRLSGRITKTYTYLETPIPGSKPVISFLVNVIPEPMISEFHLNTATSLFNSSYGRSVLGITPWAPLTTDEFRRLSMAETGNNICVLAKNRSNRALACLFAHVHMWSDTYIVWITMAFHHNWLENNDGTELIRKTFDGLRNYLQLEYQDPPALVGLISPIDRTMQTFMNAFVGNLSSGPIDTTNTYSQALVPMAKVPWIREAHLLGRLYPSGGWRCPDGPESDMEDNSGSEIKVDVESDTGDDGESETKPDVKSETKVNADSETKVDTKGETNNVTKTETDIDSKTKINLDITNVDINSGRKAHIETETNPISQVTATVSEIDPSDDEGTGMEIDPHAKVNIEVGTEVEDDEENEADSLASIPWSVDSAATQPMPGDRYEMGPTKKGYGWLVIVECTKVPTESPGLAPVPKEARPEPPKRRDRRFPPPVPRPLALVRRQG